MFSSNFKSKKNWRPPTAKIKYKLTKCALLARKFTIFIWIFNTISDFYVISFWGPPTSGHWWGAPLWGGRGPGAVYLPLVWPNKVLDAIWKKGLHQVLIFKLKKSMCEANETTLNHGEVFLLLHAVLYIHPFFYRSQTTKLDGPRKYVLNKFTNKKF